MKLWQKILFIAVLTVFVAASITISLLSVSRAPYKFEEKEAVGGEAGVDGWVFVSLTAMPGPKHCTLTLSATKTATTPTKRNL